MPNRVEITAEPGLASLLESDQPVADATLQPAVDAFLNTPGLTDSKLHEELTATLERHAETTGETSGWFTPLKEWWTGIRHRVLRTEQQPVVVASYWLTLPDVPNAKVTVTSSVEKSNESSASLTIAGIGGGPTFTATLKDSVDLDATETERAWKTRIGTFQEIEETYGGKVIARYPRLVRIDGDDEGDWTRATEAFPDLATLGPSKQRKFNFAGATGKTTETLTISRGTTWELGLDVNLPSLQLGFQASVKIAYNCDVDYAYELPKGHNYIAHRYASFPAYIWAVDPDTRT
jgi:hypothetical protein